MLTQAGLCGGQGLAEVLGRGDVRRQVLMDGQSGLEPDPNQRPDCSAGSRVQPQVPQAGIDKAQYVSRGQVGWGSGQGARLSKRAETVRGSAATLAYAAGPEMLWIPQHTGVCTQTIRGSYQPHRLSSQSPPKL